MSNPFKVSEKPIEVTVEYAINDDGFLVIIDNELIRGKYKDNIKKAVAKFRRENWQTFNVTLRSSIVHTENGSVIDQAMYRDLKLRTLLQSLKYDGDNEAELNREFYDELDPDFATILMERYDESSTQNKELEKILLGTETEEDSDLESKNKKESEPKEEEKPDEKEK